MTAMYGQNLLSHIRAHAIEQPERAAFTFLLDGEREQSVLTFGALDRRARAVANTLTAEGARGKRALLLYAPDLDYIIGFLGCVYAGVIAVPAYPPDPSRLERTLPRLRSIVADASVDVILTTTQINALATMLFDQAPELAERRWIVTDSLDSNAGDGWQPPPLEPTSIAFIQYTSGSTGSPKGVVLTHDNLMSNLQLITAAFGAGEQSVGFSWLPPYHDMGLIGGILGPLYLGCHSALMSPIAFLQRPMRWLEGISRFQATISGGPNFAYDLCVRRVQPEDFHSLDLSSWQLAFSGAEPVRPETLQRFSETFEQCGFERRAFFPCYGLAEATLIVSGGDHSREPVAKEFDVAELERGQGALTPSGTGRLLVGCGTTLGEQQIRIVDPSRSVAVTDGTVGEIWVSGSSVASQYWNKPEVSETTLRARLADEPERTFLRTGDLGFLESGELFVTGRLKDLIIVRGRNLYPQDIEKTAEESHPALRRGCCAAFSMDLGERGEQVVVAVELERRYHQRRSAVTSERARSQRQLSDRRDPMALANLQTLGAEAPGPAPMSEICDDVRAAVALEHSIRPDLVLLVKAGALPKTSSGKIQRAETKRMLVRGTLETLERSEAGSDSRDLSITDTPPLSSRELLTVPRGNRSDQVARYLRTLVARGLSVSDEEVDVHAPLASFGLDSLAAVEIGHEVERNLGTVLPASAFLRDSTIATLAQSVASRIRSAPPPPSIRNTGLSGRPFALSEGQKAIWFLQQLDPETAAYNVGCALQLGPGVDEGDLERALRSIVHRHEVLRTSFFVTDDGVPAQRVNMDATATLECIDARTWPSSRLRDEVSRTAHEPFSLEEHVLLRSRWYRGSAGGVLVLATHHIAVDFWAMTLLLDELRAALITLQSDGETLPELPPRARYSDYVRWQANDMQVAGDEHWEYWRDHLQGDAGRLELPADRRRPPKQSHRGAMHYFTISPELTARLRGFARERSATLFNVLLAGYQLVLSRWTASTDVRVATPAAGRTRAKFSELVGLLMNPIVMRADLSDNPSFSELLARVRQDVLDALDHHEFPFAQLVNRMRPDRDPARMPLVDTLFAFEQASTRDPVLGRLALGVAGAHGEWGRVRVEAFPYEAQSSQFDLSLIVGDGEDHLSAWMSYCTDLFEASTIERLSADFVRLLEAAVDRPHTPVLQLPIGGPEMVDHVRAWNEAAVRDLPRERCAHRAIEAQAARHPTATALSMTDGTSVTLGELDAQANRIADALRRAGARRGDVVGIHVARGPQLLAAHLGVMKSGAAFVPLDPTLPPDRVTYMLEDSRASIVLTDNQPAVRLEGVAYVDIAESAPPGAAHGGMRPDTTGDDIAYILYTSGSTGRPKGVAISHLSLTNLLASMASELSLTKDDVIAATTTTAFDISYLELLLPLMLGARMVLLRSDESLDGNLLVATLASQKVTAMQATPATWQLLAETEKIPAGIKVLSGGEALSESLADALVRDGRSVYNGYGPTETAIYSTCERITAQRSKVLVGTPIANTSIYVVDQYGQLVPPGVIGEICIGGVGVAPGYWRRPSLTAERFVPDPFSTTPGARVYRTGDLGRRLADGSLEHLGRQDAQVKIRGYRIELGEVEAVLGSHLAVRDAAVIVRRVVGNSTGLVGFVVPKRGTSVGPGELRQFLSGALPRYMVPDRIEVIREMPRTASQKLDRAALLASLTALPTAEVVAPRDEIEEALSEIFRDVLELDKVGVTSDFFALGGHSLLATRVMTRISATLEVTLHVRDLFESPTVELLAHRVRRERAAPKRRGGALFKRIERAPRKKAPSPTSSAVGEDKIGRR